jgi:beta-glucosidase
MPKNQFPKDFLWGASTASYQVEGGNTNQWSEWEQANADFLARTAVNRLGWQPNWESIKAAAEDPSNYISGSGVEHYSRYATDFNLLEEMYMNSFRCGFEWSRLQPTEGAWDSAAVAHYHDYLAELKKRNITPIVTLWHWTMPAWFAQKGGFAKKRNLKYFDDFVTRFMQEFGGEVGHIITLNEPNVYATFSYLLGLWPPQRKNPLMFFRVYYNLAQAHKRAYKIIKSSQPDCRVGVAAQLSDTRAATPRNLLNRLTVQLSAYGWNWWFLNRIRRHSDFIGVNYYFTQYLNWRGQQKNPAAPLNDMAWYMEPTGIGNVLTAAWQRYKLPIIITENGLADATDGQRKWWLQATLSAVQKALAAGVIVQGYLHWSLLDNFEWAYGWWPKFGLVAVDRKTGERTLRPSAHYLAEYIHHHQK